MITLMALAMAFAVAALSAPIQAQAMSPSIPVVAYGFDASNLCLEPDAVGSTINHTRRVGFHVNDTVPLSMRVTVIQGNRTFTGNIRPECRTGIVVGNARTVTFSGILTYSGSFS